jgi:CMP-N,N'-diacetyllegionaminic acid synthase
MLSIDNMQALFIIPARGGSKGIPGKNIKLLNGKPLLHYSIEYARIFTGDENICLSTDDNKIIACAQTVGLVVPFIRPEALATDESGTYGVLQHAWNYYHKLGKNYDTIVLLQPTSPLRKPNHLQEALALFSAQTDMVVSVKESKANPYYNLFEEDGEGFLTISKGKGNYTRRQDIPKVYEYNGAIYIINTTSLMNKKSFSEFTAIRKFVMEDSFSVDLDTQEDWDLAEYKLHHSHS